MIVYFFVGILLAVVSDMIKAARKNKPKQLPTTQYCCAPETVEVAWEPVEIVEPDEDPTVLLARADVDRFEAVKGVYVDLLDALEEEAQAIERELKSPEMTDKRRTTLTRRKSMLLGKIATTTAKVYSIDRQIEKAYQIAVA